ncbi:methyltransferase domain-containing protein [Rhodococcus qingshengii]|uniref:methyltransferase domain-containing protein n=1 Tax=Rhodococcus qingshengii TaxID=334542 RepID=UPI0036D9053A
MSADVRCKVCSDKVVECMDFGRQPLSDVFPKEVADAPFTFRLGVGICVGCTMVQLTEEVPRDRMFHDDYPYYSSGSSVMRAHFEGFAERMLSTELAQTDPFVVEIGCNDGVMLAVLAESGIRHLGVEPSGSVADLAAQRGVRVRKAFFEESTALEIRAESGPADLVYAANTLCHIPYVESVLRGVSALLRPTGVFVFEDPYLGDIVARNSFDQIYDEHFYYFTARSVQEMAARCGLRLVDVERIPVHGGEVRYTLAHAAGRPPSPAVEQLLAEESERGLAESQTLHALGSRVATNRNELAALLHRLKAEGKTVVGYGATAKSATVNNYCNIDRELVPFVCDSTPAKQGRLTPGTHIPVHPPERFADPFPDYALLYAWNHADEIMEKEQEFRDAGGKWIVYVPEVAVL